MKAYDSLNVARMQAGCKSKQTGEKHTVLDFDGVFYVGTAVELSTLKKEEVKVVEVSPVQDVEAGWELAAANVLTVPSKPVKKSASKPASKKMKVVKVKSEVKGMTDRRLGKIKERAQEVMKYATENYEKGFDWIVECLSVEEIAKEMMETKCTSTVAALQHYRQIAKLRAEQAGNQAW
jgi:hypothetical protein